MAVKDVLGGIDPKRLADAYSKVKRRHIAEGIAESTDDMTQIEAIEFIKNMEDAVIEEFKPHGDPVPDYVLRIMAQRALIDKLVEKIDNGEQES